MSSRSKTTVTVLPLSNRLPTPSKAVVRLDQIDPSPFNQRIFADNDPRDLELTDNLRATGRIFEPLLVRPENDRFRLIAGERRLRSGQEAGLVEADVMIYDVDEQTANLMTFMENHFRKDLHFLEEAAAVESLLTSGLTQEMIAAQIGMPVKWVALRARLSQLSDRWRELVVSSDPRYVVRLWSASHLEAIALLGEEAQDGLLESHPYLARSEPSVSELRGLVAESTRQLAGAPWRLEDDSLCPQAGACTACALRTSVHPMLFEDLVEETSTKKDRCLNASCWSSKMMAFLTRREAELRQNHPELVLLTTGSTRQDGALAAWSVRPAKKNQPGAVPALVLDGSDRGKLRWVVPPEPPEAGIHGRLPGAFDPGSGATRQDPSSRSQGSPRSPPEAPGHGNDRRGGGGKRAGPFSGGCARPHVCLRHGAHPQLRLIPRFLGSRPLLAGWHQRRAARPLESRHGSGTLREPSPGPRRPALAPRAPCPLEAHGQHRHSGGHPSGL